MIMISGGLRAPNQPAAESNVPGPSHPSRRVLPSLVLLAVLLIPLLIPAPAAEAQVPASIASMEYRDGHREAAKARRAELMRRSNASSKSSACLLKSRRYFSAMLKPRGR